MPEENQENNNISDVFQTMSKDLETLKGEIDAWKRQKRYNLHLLRPDQLKTTLWTDFCKVFAFPLFPKDTMCFWLDFMKRSGWLPSNSKKVKADYLKAKPLFEKMKKEDGAQLVVDQMLSSPHIDSVISFKKHLVNILHPNEELHHILNSLRAKCKDIRWVQDAFFQWLIICNYLCFSDLLLVPKGHRSKDHLKKENLNPTKTVQWNRREFAKYKNQLMIMKASLPNGDGFFKRKLKYLDLLIERCNASLHCFRHIHFSRKRGRPFDIKMSSFFATICSHYSPRDLPQLENEILILVDYIFPIKDTADGAMTKTHSKKLFASHFRLKPTA